MDKVEVATRSIYEGPAAVAAAAVVSKSHVSRIAVEVFGSGGIKRFRSRMRHVDVPTDVATLAYMAGIIDGEGWVSFVSGTGWKLGVANTHRGVCDWVCNHFGGHVHDRAERGRSIFKSVRPSFQWSLQRAPDVLAVLCAIEPYMIIKRDKALEAINDIGEWWSWGDGSWSEPILCLPGDGNPPISA